MKYFLYIIICFLAPFFTDVFAEKNQSLAELEEKLGKDFSNKKPDTNIKGVSALSGESLVKKGFSINKSGKKSSKQSKHFVCISCHNIVKEDPDLANPNPEARLTYAFQQNLPFLQGSSLYGVINRSTYFNGDYDKKYGDKVFKARDNVREAIQLCATKNARGRKLHDGELESVISYLWTIGIKTQDLAISDFEQVALDQAVVAEDQELKIKALDLLSFKYMEKSNATIIESSNKVKTENLLSGAAINGAKIYNLSCLYCHQKQKFSYLRLDESKMSIRYLKKHLPVHHRQSIYNITRNGVSSYSGRNSHMPLYTAERLSEQQLADLVTFISQN